MRRMLQKDCGGREGCSTFGAQRADGSVDEADRCENTGTSVGIAREVSHTPTFTTPTHLSLCDWSVSIATPSWKPQASDA
jgi:hypothetical protein